MEYLQMLQLLQNGQNNETIVSKGALSKGIFVLQEEQRKLQQGATSYYDENKSWIDGLAIAFGVQAIIGIIAIEYAFARGRRFIHNKDDERDRKFAPFARLDTDRWYRFKFYPGAMFAMPARLLLLILLGLLLMLIGKIITLGHNYNEGPLPNGCRKSVMNWLYRTTAKIWIFISGFCCTSMIEVDADYSEYLGPDYKEQYDKEIQSTSTIISNHVTQHDSMMITQFMNNAFACDISFKSVPLMGGLAQMVDAIFVPRGGTDEARQKIIQIISDRQDVVEKTAKFSPLLYFPEGGTTNGQYLLKFKRGIFMSKKRMQPIVLKYTVNGSFSPAFDVIELLPLFIMELSWSCLKCKIYKLPEIYPTEYLFNRPEAQGKPDWEVYQDFAYDVMCKYGELKPSDISLREKLHYEGYMQMNRKYPTPYKEQNEKLRAEKEQQKSSDLNDGLLAKNSGDKSSNEKLNNHTEMQKLDGDNQARGINSCDTVPDLEAQKGNGNNKIQNKENGKDYQEEGGADGRLPTAQSSDRNLNVD